MLPATWLILVAGCGLDQSGATVESVPIPPRASIRKELVADVSTPVLRVGEEELGGDFQLGVQGPIVAEMVTRGDSVDGVIIGDWDRLILAKTRGATVVKATQIGRRGLGPEEYLGIRALCVTQGDTISVVDASTRVTVLTGEGKVVTQHLAAAKGDILPQGACAESGWLLFLGAIDVKTMSVEILSLNGKRRQTALRIPATPLVPGEPFALPLAVGAGVDIATADPFGASILIRDTLGVPIRRYEFQEAPPVPPKDLAGLVPIPFGKGSGGRSMPLSVSRWPYFKSLMFTDTGDLWLQDFATSRAADEVWTGVTSKGQVIGRLALKTNEMSTELRALRFTSCCVLVDRADEEGRRSVELLRITERK